MRPLLLALLVVSGCSGGATMLADAGAPPPCPADPPASGAPCAASQSCTWLRCPGQGVVRASCSGGAWAVSTSACGPHDCSAGGQTCADDQICLEHAGGALIVDCVANPCGTRAIEASCACGLCTGSPCTIDDLTVQCDTCPGPQPCP